MDPWQPIWTSLRVGLAATLCAFPLGLLLAGIAAHWRFRYWVWAESLILLPLLLPGPVLGYSVLMAVTATGPVGFASRYGQGSPILFSESVAVLAAILHTVPLVALLAVAALRDIPRVYFKLAGVLGIAEWRVFLRIALPLAARPLAAIAVLAMARAMSEFGIFLLLAHPAKQSAVTLPWALSHGIFSAADLHRVLLWFAVSLALTLLLLAAAMRIRSTGRPV